MLSALAAWYALLALTVRVLLLPCAQVPAVPDTRVVDVTGCGNAFCGGFLAGLDSGLNLQQSGIWGCVAGSIMAEAQGVPVADVRFLLPAAHAKQQQLLQHMGLPCAAAASSSSSTISSTAVQCTRSITNISRPWLAVPPTRQQHWLHCNSVPRLVGAVGSCRRVVAKTSSVAAARGAVARASDHRITRL
jgi:hypothetical protein